MRLDNRVKDCQPYYMMLLDRVFARASDFDVIHFHIDLIHFPLFRAVAQRTITTLHGQLCLSDLQPFYRHFPEMPLVSISYAQRAPLPPVNWAATVYHGMPQNLYRPYFSSGDYLAFVGRISPEKGVESAIDIAEQVQMPLKIAAKVDKADQCYFDARVKPRLNSRYVEFVGEVNDREKNELLGGAMALLFPIAWQEPFGIVMIEAMACATPVIAFNYGSVPEVLEDGVTGFVVDNVGEAITAVRHVAGLDRQLIRKRFEHRFTVGQMTSKYLDVYGRQLSDSGMSAIAAE